MTDKHVESVIKKIQSRSEVGYKKYGTTLERDDYDLLDWLNEAQAEAMDLALYLEVIKFKLTEINEQ